MAKDVFVRYNTPEEYAEAFRKMVHVKDEWLAQVRHCEEKLAL